MIFSFLVHLFLHGFTSVFSNFATFYTSAHCRLAVYSSVPHLHLLKTSFLQMTVLAILLSLCTHSTHLTYHIMQTSQRTISPYSLPRNESLLHSHEPTLLPKGFMATITTCSKCSWVRGGEVGGAEFTTWSLGSHKRVHRNTPEQDYPWTNSQYMKHNNGFSHVKSTC